MFHFKPRRMQTRQLQLETNSSVSAFINSLSVLFGEYYHRRATLVRLHVEVAMRNVEVI